MKMKHCIYRLCLSSVLKSSHSAQASVVPTAKPKFCNANNYSTPAKDNATLHSSSIFWHDTALRRCGRWCNLAGFSPVKIATPWKPSSVASWAASSKKIKKKHAA